MEAAARMHGTTGIHTGTGATGEHVHQLLALTAALTRATAAAAQASSLGHTDADSHPDFTAEGPLTADSQVSGLVAGPLGVELESLTDSESVKWAQDLEHLARVLAALQVQSAGNLASRSRAGRFDTTGASSPADLIVTTLRVSRAEANRRLRLSRHFLPSINPLTLVTTFPDQPVLAAAFFSGTLSMELALMASSNTDIAASLAKAGRIDQDAADLLESTLAHYAQQEGPDFLRPVAARALDHLDPNGQEPTEGELTAKQGIFFHRPHRGLIHYDGYLTINQYEALMAAIGWASNPNHQKDINTLNTLTDIEPGSTHSAGTGTSQTSGGNTKEPSPNTSTDAGSDASLNAGGTGGSSVNSGDQRKRVETRGDVLPGQTDLLEILRTTIGKTTAPEANPDRDWPPPQGPAPDWAQPPIPSVSSSPSTGATNGTIGGATSGGRESGGTDTGFWATPGTGPSPTDCSAGPDFDAEHPVGIGPDLDAEPVGIGIGIGNGGRDTVPPWPHAVDGILVPEPGSIEGLPGLDPIDPNCNDHAVQDKRTHGQKLLEGLIDCVKLAARTKLLPINGGLKPQLIISTTETNIQASRTQGKGCGIAFLPYTGPNSLALFDTELCDADVTTMILGNGQEILNVGRTQRLFTNAQRKLLIARDIGCSFPHCTRPASWCDAHHIVPWQDGGETCISNGALACAYHHTLIHKGYWTVRLLNGIPFYTPAYSIDHQRQERRNSYHHGLIDPGT